MTEPRTGRLRQRVAPYVRHHQVAGFRGLLRGGGPGVRAELGGQVGERFGTAGVARVSDRMLWQTLQRLEDDGLAIRTPHPTVARRLDYELTDLGQPITERICDLIDAIYEQLPGIVAHQRALGSTVASPAEEPSD
ncbi:winged helix-turn-helix transcriptional regulator [Streptomyces sp. NPDC002888]|uniref:winged helix-turn-helix transcriptional regulator n=1 Tax=Streptomyces sp. NPDC002888 TaxID=3364668 RepID=UPI0036A1043B